MPFEFEKSKEAVRKLAFARVRDAAYDAIYSLWMRRKGEGVSQQHIAQYLERDPAWVSRNLAGPGNWTLKTFGELADALNAVVRIEVLPKEEIAPSNFDIYAKDEADDLDLHLEAIPTIVERPSGNVMINAKLPHGPNARAIVRPKVLTYAR